MIQTFRGRLTAAIAGVAVASVAVTALIAIGLVARSTRDDARKQLARDARVLARDPGPGGSLSPPGVRFEGGVRILRGTGAHVAIVLRDGSVFTFSDPVAEQIARRVNLLTQPDGVFSRVGVDGVDYETVVVAMGGRRGAVLLARPSSIARDLFRSVVVRVTLAGVLAVLAAAMVASTFAGRMSGRMQELGDAAGAIAAGDLSKRVPEDGDQELATLGSRFNAMAASLSESRRRETEFLASVSHELRTPITAIRGYAEALTDGTARTAEDRERAAAIIESESYRLERLVQDVVDLARLGARQFGLETAAVDLARTLNDAVDAHAPSATAAGVGLSASIEASLPAVTDASRVKQIVSNLVENALRVTPEGGSVLVSGRRDADTIVVEVADNGPGIAESDLAHAFERAYLWHAYRAERPAGSGLGLAIVRELAEALGGRVEVTSTLGQGSAFRLLLPARS